MCYAQMVVESIRRARKPRKCSGCKRELVVGEEYVRRFVRMERDEPPDVAHYHPRCAGLLDLAVAELSGECLYGSERDFIRENGAGDGRWRGFREELRKATARVLERCRGRKAP